MAKERRERTVRNRETNPSILREARRLLLSEEWSPRQISGWLKKKGIRISHERIYEMIRNDNSGELRGHCRHRMKYRRHKKRKRPTKATNIPDRVSIHERPAEADGKRFGDWEMDLVLGKVQKSAILTLCERSRNDLIMERLPQGKNPDAVAETVTRLLWPYRKNVLSITTDNGVEFCRHRRTDFRDLTDEYIHSVQLKINRRPREKLNFSTPKDEFFNFCCNFTSCCTCSLTQPISNISSIP